MQATRELGGAGDLSVRCLISGKTAPCASSSQPAVHPSDTRAPPSMLRQEAAGTEIDFSFMPTSATMKIGEDCTEGVAFSKGCMYFAMMCDVGSRCTERPHMCCCR